MYCRRPSGFFRTTLRSKRHSRFTSVRTEGPFHSRAEHRPQATRWALNSVESLPGNLCEADRSMPTVCTNAASRGSTQLPRSERPEKPNVFDKNANKPYGKTRISLEMSVVFRARQRSMTQAGNTETKHSSIKESRTERRRQLL